MINLKIGTKLSGLVCTAAIISTVFCGCSGADPATKTDTIVSTSTNSTTSIISNTSDPNVSLVSSISTVKAGGTFDIMVRVSNTQPSRGMEFAITWDSSQVECVSVTKGNYFSDFAAANSGDVYLLPSNPVADNQAGRFPKNVNTNPESQPTLQNIALMGAQGPAGSDTLLGPTGSGDVYILHMIAK